MIGLQYSERPTMAAKRHHESKLGGNAMKHRRASKMMKPGSEQNYVNSGNYEFENAMISEDHSAPCLLPTKVIHREFPGEPRQAMSMVGDDLYQGAQRQIAEDERDLRKLKAPRRW